MLVDGAIGVRFSPDGSTMYLTDATGLGIYDVANPASPQIRSHLPLPRVVAGGATHLVDVSDPAAPAIRATRPGPDDLTVYDVRDLSRPPVLVRSREERQLARPPVAIPPPDEELAWVCGGEATFAFDVTDAARPRLVLGGPGQPQPGHRRLVGELTREARGRAWPHRGAPVGFYATSAGIWGAYLAPADCPPLGSRGRATERVPLSPIGEWGRAASWGRGPVPSPSVLA